MEKILIADDSITARLIIKQCLQIAGFDPSCFTEAEDGQAAWEVINNQKISLLVTDLNMPRMNGDELLDLVHNDSAINLPVVFITSAGNLAKETELMDRGAYAVIKKPISPNLIAHKLESFLTENTSARGEL